MKRVHANPVENKANPAKANALGRVRLAKVVAAKPSYSKSVRQAAFGKVASHLPVAMAVSQAKLISKVNPAEFRIVRMPG